MTTQTHSPLPWTIDYSGRFTTFIASNGNEVAAMPDQDHDSFRPTETELADAQLICTAVNAHAALVASLEGIADRLAPFLSQRDPSSDTLDIPQSVLREIWGVSRAALLGARGQK